MMLAALLGGLIGTVLALTGAGGGILAVPLLVMVLHLPMQQAAPTALLVVGMVSAVGAVLGLRQGIVRYRAAMLIGGMGTLSAPLGSYVAARLPQVWLLGGFAGLMLLLAWRQWQADPQATTRADLPCVTQPLCGRLQWTSACARALAITGGVSGFFSGLVGVGGGFVIVPSLARYSNLPWHHIQATSLAVIALVSASATAHAVWNGQIVWPVALPFAGGALTCYLLLRQPAQRLPRELLRRLFAVLVLAVAIVMLLKLLHVLA